MRSSKQVAVPPRLASARAKLVYLALATGGPATVDDLAARLNETRLALLSILGTLEERGLVVRGAEGFALA
jgi:DNA-binding IscR family transcriptional regulator